jgi:N6-L-threonylcarbamoyladenine synthase
MKMERKELEKLAAANTKKVPKPKISVQGTKCNLSGLENIADKLYATTSDKELVAAFTLDFVAETLFALSENLRTDAPNLPILYAGGVMSNQRIKKRLSALDHTNFSEPQFSADNAAGIALLCKMANEINEEK